MDEIDHKLFPPPPKTPTPIAIPHLCPSFCLPLFPPTPPESSNRGKHRGTETTSRSWRKRGFTPTYRIKARGRSPEVTPPPVALRLERRRVPGYPQLCFLARLVFDARGGSCVGFLGEYPERILASHHRLFPSSVFARVLGDASGIRNRAGGREPAVATRSRDRKATRCRQQT